MPKCCAHTKLYTYGEHPSSHSSSKMLWRRNPRCGTLRRRRFTCEHPSTTLSCIMMNPQRGGAFFCCGGGEVKDANPCGIKSFCARTDPDTYLFKHVPKSLLPQGSGACAARRFRTFPRFGRGVKFAKMLRQYKALPL